MAASSEYPDSSELSRFSERVGVKHAALYNHGPFEREVKWQVLDCAGSSRSIESRLAMTISVSRVTWERPWTLGFAPDPSTLKFIVARGPGLRVHSPGVGAHELESGTGHVSRIHRPVELYFEFGETNAGQAHEELCVEVSKSRLCQLMGSDHLPSLLEGVWASSELYPFHVLPAPAASFRLLDEVAHCDGRGAARQLYLESKGLELLSAWVDSIEEERRASGSLSAYDIERLEQARRVLLARMTAPPRLPDLARLVGLNEAKLKAGFRLHFGETIFGYLRQQRLSAAHELLREGRYNVTEVAMRVGYANPSKFAAAFKAHFGLAPSAVR